MVWLGMMTLLTYLNAGLVREQICLHACPYSRFQGVMMDDDTQKVSYDYVRGEPRGKQEATQRSPSGCIDCTLCVQVCPTGIDIREGMQAGCIDCGACIDVCDQVMSKIEQPKGLIRFASERQLSGQKSPILRPRLAGYLLISLMGVAGAVYGLASKQDLTAEVRRERGELFRVQGNGQLCNFYRIKVEGFNPILETVQVDLLNYPALELAGPDTLLLDNRGDWVAYRICGKPQGERVQTLQLQFTAGPVVLNRQTTFISPSNP
jgi:cytochrome c oxidase accessory protein FixG